MKLLAVSATIMQQHKATFICKHKRNTHFNSESVLLGTVNGFFEYKQNWDTAEFTDKTVVRL